MCSANLNEAVVCLREGNGLLNSGCCDKARPSICIVQLQPATAASAHSFLKPAESPLANTRVLAQQGGMSQSQQDQETVQNPISETQLKEEDVKAAL